MKSICTYCKGHNFSKSIFHHVTFQTLARKIEINCKPSGPVGKTVTSRATVYNTEIDAGSNPAVASC